MINGYNLRTDFKRAISQVGAIVESPTFYDYLSGYGSISNYSIINLMNTFHEMFIYSATSQEIFTRLGIIAAYIIFFYICSIIHIKKKDVLL